MRVPRVLFSQRRSTQREISDTRHNQPQREVVRVVAILNPDCVCLSGLHLQAVTLRPGLLVQQVKFTQSENPARHPCKQPLVRDNETSMRV
jgi:hypothetical protein